MHVFEGITADEVWQKAALEFRTPGKAHLQPSRAGETQEILGAVLTINDPRQRWIVSRQPAINPAFALAEVVWILAGRRDAAFLNHWNPKLPEFAGHSKNYHGAYGYRLRRHLGLDQLDRAYNTLRANPETRQVVLQIWDSSVDLPDAKGRPVNADIPCNVCSFVKVRQGRLEWTQVVRSNDLVLGVPHNVVQFTSLQEILAGWLGLAVGEYRHLSDCLHVYSRDLANLQATSQIRIERNVDSLSLPKEQSDRSVTRIADRMDRMTNRRISQSELEKLALDNELEIGFHNWMMVIAADSARRRGWFNLTRELMKRCSNPAFAQLWERWMERWSARPTPQSSFADSTLYRQPMLPFGLTLKPS